MLTTEEYDILQDIIVTNEGKEERVDLPQGTLSLSRGLEKKEDDIIIVHQGTPEDLIRVVLETLQEIMGINNGNSISREQQKRSWVSPIRLLFMMNQERKSLVSPREQWRRLWASLRKS